MNATFTRAFTFFAVLTAPFFQTASAQTETEAQVTDDATGETRTVPLLNAEQLDELLGPIALYPDALIALILPAATMPTDVVLASRYLGAGGDTAKVDDQPWDESVRALAHYPDVVKWMDDKLSWAIMVGDAFVAQPVDVMQSVQRLRARARAAGTLTDSAQQKVVEEEGSIRIIPAQPEVIYVPVYDPQVVYVERSPYWGWGWGTSLITYRWCYPTGIWLSYDCDWYHHRVWVVDRHHRNSWYHDRGWVRPREYRHRDYVDRGFGRSWMPNPDRRHPDFRRDGRGRDTRVVIRDGRRDFDGDRRHDGVDRRAPRADDGGLGDRFNVVPERSRNEPRDGIRREVGSDTRREPADRRGGADDRRPGVDRRERPDNVNVVSEPRTPRAPRPATPAPRVVPPPVRERVATTTPPAVSPPTATPRTPASGARWIDRATGTSPNIRRTVEPAAPRVNPPPPRVTAPAPRVVTPAPRAAPPAARTPAAPPPAPSQTVRIPLSGGGSRAVVVNPPASGDRGSRAPAADRSASRSEDRGSRAVPGRDRGSRNGDK